MALIHKVSSIHVLYSVLQLCPSYRQVKCKLHSIHLHSGTLSLFLPMYTGPQNQYTKMKVNKVEPEWLYDCQNTKQENFWEDSTKNYLL